MKRIETCFAIIINQAQRVGYGNRKFGIFLITDTISEYSLKSTDKVWMLSYNIQ